MRDLKPGLTLEQHRQLGESLRQLRRQVLDLRGVIKAGIGSATSGYSEATKAAQALERLQTTMLLEATGEYADQTSLQELRALYGNGEGACG